MAHRCLLGVLLFLTSGGELIAAATDYGVSKKPDKSERLIAHSMREEVSQLLRKFEKTNDPRDLQTATLMIRFVGSQARTSTKNTFRNTAEQLQLIFKVFNYLDARLVPNYDFNDPPRLNVPARGTGFPNGVEPETIEDARLRSEYLLAIAKNDALYLRYTYQAGLHKVEKTSLRLFDTIISNQLPKSTNNSFLELIDVSVNSKPRAASLKLIAGKLFATKH